MVHDDSSADAVTFTDGGGQATTVEEFARQYGERVDSIFPNPGGGIYSASLSHVDPSEAAEISAWITKATGIEQPV